MRQLKLKKHFIFWAISLIVVAAVSILFMQYRYIKAEEKNIEAIYSQNYIPVKQAMAAAGYSFSAEEENTYTLENSNVNIRFDIENAVCEKNRYTFSMEGKTLLFNDEIYIDADILGEITNGIFSRKGKEIEYIPRQYTQHEWTRVFPPFIAHAGGGWRGGEKNATYTNSMEALVENYNLGHRVFEFDFYLTSDEKLAVVHDWEQFGYKDGTALSEQEWRGFSYPYTTMMLGDLLDEMLVNKDMFIVTDTKSFEITEEEMARQFEIIRNEAQKRDPALLERIIPQIYNIDMYHKLAQIYPFQSVIFTLYARTDEWVDISEFIASHEEVKVITMPARDEWWEETKDFRKMMVQNDKIIYVHTLNQYVDIAEWLNRKEADGIYTDYILPYDYEVYIETAETSQEKS